MDKNQIIKESLEKEDCIGYKYNLYDMVFPPILTIFNTLCMSTDKTYLFIVSFIRCIIVGLLIKIIYENIDIIKYKYVYRGIVAYGIINIVALVFVMMKQQKYRKQFVIINNKDDDNAESNE